MKKHQPKPEAVSPEDVELIEETAREIESKREYQLDPSTVDVSWIDDNDGCGPEKLSNSIRCF